MYYYQSEAFLLWESIDYRSLIVVVANVYLFVIGNHVTCQPIVIGLCQSDLRPFTLPYVYGQDPFKLDALFLVLEAFRD